MKKHYVYEIVNLMGTVEYVGETINPKNRFQSHKCSRISNGSGKFYKRSDVFMNIVCEFDNRKDAYDYQCKLQKEYGFKSDREKSANAGILGKEYGYLGGLKIKKPVIAYCKVTKNIIKEYDSITAASNELKVNLGCIHSILHGKRKSSGGYYFEYKN